MQKVLITIATFIGLETLKNGLTKDNWAEVGEGILDFIRGFAKGTKEDSNDTEQNM